MSEIEKQFFDTFGIKAYYKYLLIDKTTKWRHEKLLDKANFIDFVRSGKDYLLLKVVKYYPQITDRIYLMLLATLTCISSIEFPFSDIQKLKEDILKEVIKHLYGFDKHQVQALFKENN